MPCLTLHITWKFLPDEVTAFYDVLRPLQEKLIQEKECLYFNVYEVGQDSGIVRLIEIWDCDMKWMANVRLSGRFSLILVPFSPFQVG
jgi:quinol monooxygenase YgiN